MNNYKRWQYTTLVNGLNTRRVIILSGARQCGKTTLAKSIATEQTIYRTLDDLTQLESAQTDPHGFVKHQNELMIIDEVQRAPQILQAIKKDVDENQRTGRFLLTGSANIQSLPGVKESLAGRTRKIRLRALSQGEIYGTQPEFLTQAFAEKFNNQISNFSKDDYIAMALKGGYPEALTFSELKETHRWYNDYIAALIERDLKDIINIKRQDSIKELMYVLSAWSSKFMDITSIATGIELNRITLNSYINALETLFLVERVPPWTKTEYDRVSKQSKMFMTDTGVMSSILRWNLDKVRLDGQLNGKLLETFVFTQLAAHIDASDESFNLFHYRDREKREIDFMIENDNGDILGIEVKSGSAISKNDFKHLQWFKNNIAKESKFIGLVLYTGEHIAGFGVNMWAIPISRLWVPH